MIKNNQYVLQFRSAHAVFYSKLVHHKCYSLLSNLFLTCELKEEKCVLNE